MASELVEHLEVMASSSEVGGNHNTAHYLRKASARISELEARERVLASFVKSVASQKLSDDAREWCAGEFGDEHEPDFEGAYDSIIKDARRAASALEAK